ncbi:hypothetical protein WG68_14700 [Arsukibacterium ikkense]|uniref:Solute-binding protein family 3/N-terminal domain-containing protein n=2 Tax=Arsukibacterium ikkense TaxID=336831 RepID=A0A0M2V1D7_9GAMM|nr:hypothetical protein WG68_14700 [Arsukibacterium ikkense]
MFLGSVCTLLVFDLQAKPMLTWLQTDWPPHQIVSGPYQGQGTFDLLQLQITARLPQFNHQTRLVSLPRLEQVFAEGEASHCTVGTLYSEQRASNRLFSHPIAAGPALAVGYTGGRLNEHPAMQADGAVIGQLVQDPELSGVYQPNRYYPDIIMAAMRLTDSNLNSYPFTGEVNAVALLASSRVDYVVEYPERLEYFNKLLAEHVALEHRAIVGANIASVSYVTCTLDTAGAAAIAAVNQVLPALWQQASYVEAMQRWLDNSARRRLSADINQLQQHALMQLQPGPDNAVNPGHQ